jgi:hypothetical protein
MLRLDFYQFLLKLIVNSFLQKYFNKTLFQIRVWDRDGPGPLQMIDPDDLMGVTFSNDDGRFQLDGCGDDFDWIPGVKNVPEPYIEVSFLIISSISKMLFSKFH